MPHFSSRTCMPRSWKEFLRGCRYFPETLNCGLSWMTVHLAAQEFTIFTEERATISIRTLPRKSHILVPAEQASQLPNNIDPQVQIHTDGIPIFGTAIGDEDFIGTFLREKLHKPDWLLCKLDKFQSNRAKYQVLKLSPQKSDTYCGHPQSRDQLWQGCAHTLISQCRTFLRGPLTCTTPLRK